MLLSFNLVYCCIQSRDPNELKSSKFKRFLNHVFFLVVILIIIDWKHDSGRKEKAQFILSAKFLS